MRGKMKASASRVIMAVSKRHPRSAVLYQRLTRRMHGIMGKGRYIAITHSESNSKVLIRPYGGAHRSQTVGKQLIRYGALLSWRKLTPTLIQPPAAKRPFRPASQSRWLAGKPRPPKAV
jgi:ribosomal protein L34E